MGQAASSIYNYYYPSNNDNENNNNDAPLLPEVIRESDVFSHVAAPLILKSLKERGYCIIRPEEGTGGLIKSCKETVEDFFLLPPDQKKKFETAYSTDPLLKGRRPNRGYIEGKAKEYLKIRLIDQEEAYPTNPPLLYHQFKTTMERMRDITLNALYSLGDVILNEEDKVKERRNNNNNNKKEETGPSTWLDVKVTDTVKSFIPEGSSVSVIKYYKIEETSGEGEDHEPLGEHVDTGIMTLIRVSEVQGLQVLDQLHNKYLNLEEVGQVGDLVLIMGRKIEFLLSEGAKLTPTLHKVVIPKNRERFSILFFMDLPGGKDV